MMVEECALAHFVLKVPVNASTTDLNGWAQTRLTGAPSAFAHTFRTPQNYSAQSITFQVGAAFDFASWTAQCIRRFIRSNKPPTFSNPDDHKKAVRFFTWHIASI